MLLACSLPAAAPALANGFFIPQQAASATGRVFAGSVAEPVDASTVFYNPAGMTKLGKAQITAGASVVSSYISFRDRGSTATALNTGGAPSAYPGGSGGNPGSPTLIPTLFAAAPVVDDRFWVGLALTAPFGQGLKYDKDWFGRYDSIESRLVTIDVAPSVAVRITDELSIGAGLDVQYADAKLTNALPDPLAPGGPSPQSDGRARLTGDDVSFGFNAGLLLEFDTGTRIGFQYRSAITHDLEGGVRVSDLGGPLASANGSSKASSRLKLPDIWTVGVAQQVGEDLTLLAQFQWFGWNRFDSLDVRYTDGQPDTVIPQDYHDSGMLAIGAEYVASESWTVRGGIQLDRTPTDDDARTTSLPDGNRIWFGLGATYLITEAIKLDLAAVHVAFDDARVGVTRTFYQGTPLETSATVKGRARTNVDTVGIALSMAF